MSPDLRTQTNHMIKIIRKLMFSKYASRWHLRFDLFVFLYLTILQPRFATKLSVSPLYLGWKIIWVSILTEPSNHHRPFPNRISMMMTRA